jgi:hypothetical protein
MTVIRATRILIVVVTCISLVWRGVRVNEIIHPSIQLYADYLHVLIEAFNMHCDTCTTRPRSLLETSGFTRYYRLQTESGSANTGLGQAYSSIFQKEERLWLFADGGTLRCFVFYYSSKQNS